MTRKQIAGIIMACLLAAAVLAGAGWMILRSTGMAAGPYAGLDETEIPYLSLEESLFSPGNPPVPPENFPAIQLKEQELSLSDFTLDGLGKEYAVEINGNRLTILREDAESTSSEPLSVSREQQYTKILQDLSAWNILDPEDDYSVTAAETYQADSLMTTSVNETTSIPFPILERGFSFVSHYNGREIILQEQGEILVWYDAKGLKSLEYLAYHPEEIPNAPTLQPLTDAVARRLTAMQEAKEWEEGYTKVAYVYLMDLDGATHRAKAYYENDLVNLEFADAETGEYISLSQFDYDPATGPAATWSATTPTDPTETTSVS